MIEIRYPGVFLSEIAFDAQPIEGVPTSTTDVVRLTSFERLTHVAAGERALDQAVRTPGADPESKYISLRRYFAYLEQSIGKSLQSAVFEPDGEQLWGNVSASVSDFLYSEWQSGALLGSRPDEAYFVRCDRSTMTQDDLDNGRLVLLVGVATVKPGEFVILRFCASTAGTNA